MNDASASFLNSGLFARLLFDIMLPADLAESLRTHGYDVAEARALPLEVQRDDRALLIEAARLQRLVVTCNYHDPHSNFCCLHEEWQVRRNNVWQLQTAKNRFSELVDRALTTGPQVVTRRGKEVVVVVPAEDWKRAQKPKQSPVGFFQMSHLRGVNVKMCRFEYTDREVDL